MPCVDCVVVVAKRLEKSNRCNAVTQTRVDADDVTGEKNKSSSDEVKFLPFSLLNDWAKCNLETDGSSGVCTKKKHTAVVIRRKQGGEGRLDSVSERERERDRERQRERQREYETDW